MKFLVDECVGASIITWLRENGFDAIAVAEKYPGITDDEVLNTAVQENRILITNDKDFGEIVFKKRKQHCGIILLRILDERPSKKILLIEQAFKNYQHMFFGNYVVVTETAVRIIKNVVIL